MNNIYYMLQDTWKGTLELLGDSLEQQRVFQMDIKGPEL